ncbi:ArsR/SmtB family transcription factor [Streptomyces griseocarneus]|uniref:ArsR/SmtB family transcription factor n=1 Tax=Streptomyces griseocarneus TaxID=51201 RepID=UPI00167C98DB|nr:winged helix-turn-helix domain-containing protein [Streptomyces griseocarneus]MBZ6477150.1 winged helix-turn-helix domain-containing protein [Streptomyces griseocarneus]GHG53821.1 putative regulatory protein [Streptomyces griseocarneus]
MIRIHFTAADFARVRFASRPAPLQELNAALMMLVSGHRDELLFGRWRQRVARSLPTAVEPLGDLVPGAVAPAFLDVFSTSLREGLDTVRASHPDVVRSEIERVYAGHGAPAPLWVRDLHRGDAGAWQVLRRAQHAAFETVLGPVWPLVQDLHQAEFTRHALTVAEHGIGTALTGLLPGARLHGNVWEFDGPGPQDVSLHGRGLVLVPTFHWTGHPVVADPPDGPLFLTYPAGPGLPLSATGAPGTEEALAAVLGRTRLAALFLLAEEHTTGDLARRLGVSDATASAHAAALRGAGLITTVRAGRAVLHRRTALGGLLVRRGGPERAGPRTRPRPDLSGAGRPAGP